MPNSDLPEEIWRQLIHESTGNSHVQKGDTIQSLWSGFGSIFKARAGEHCLVVKHVRPSDTGAHPRGWHSDFGTIRKIRSYEVERYWYRHFSHLCRSSCRVPAYLADKSQGSESWLILEDLDTAGYPHRYQVLNPETASTCLDWLARFHAQFLGTNPTGLWPVGCYWHLDTRPDEYQTMADGPLKQHAHRLDSVLNQATFQTLVHGDAKVANFCFAEQRDVAAVDFQYIGGGCGMKDVAYFIGSCFSEDQCEEYAANLLDGYFLTLKQTLAKTNFTDIAQLEEEWRSLYPIAWTDFYRFLAGWMPTHKKIHRYTKRLAEQTFDSLHTFE